MARKPNLEITLASATPWIRFADHVASGEDGVDYARESMKRLHEWVKTLPSQDAYSEIVMASLGRQILDWLLTADNDTRNACGKDFHLLKLLAHYIIVEGQEEYFWAWLKAEMTSLKTTRDLMARKRVEDRYSWIGCLLGSCVDVHLTRSHNSSADLALQLFSTLAALQHAHPGARSIKHGAMDAALQRGMSSGNFRNTDTVLYDRFVEMCYTYNKMASQTVFFDYQKALALFRHPTRPDPDPILHHFRSIESNIQARQFHPRTVSEAWWQRHLSEELSALLRSRSRHEDAACVGQLTKKFGAIVSALDRQRKPSTDGTPRTSSPRRENNTLETTPGDLLLMRKARRDKEKRRW